MCNKQEVLSKIYYYCSCCYLYLLFFIIVYFHYFSLAKSKALNVSKIASLYLLNLLSDINFKQHVPFRIFMRMNEIMHINYFVAIIVVVYIITLPEFLLVDKFKTEKDVIHLLNLTLQGLNNFSHQHRIAVLKFFGFRNTLYFSK